MEFAFETEVSKPKDIWQSERYGLWYSTRQSSASDLSPSSGEMDKDYCWSPNKDTLGIDCFDDF